MKCLLRVENPRSALYKVIDITKHKADEVEKMVNVYEEAGFLTSLKVFHGEISTRFINPSLKQKGIDDERAVA